MGRQGPGVVPGVRAPGARGLLLLRAGLGGALEIGGSQTCSAIELCPKECQGRLEQHLIAQVKPVRLR
jgi:hypothetical protein